MDYNCAAEPDVDLPVALAATLSAIASKHAGACKPIERATSLRDTLKVTQDVQVGTAADEAEFKEGSYLVSGGVLHQIVGGISTVVGVKSGRGGTGPPRNSAGRRTARARISCIRHGERAGAAGVPCTIRARNPRPSRRPPP